MDTHKQWKANVRHMDHSVAARSGAIAPTWMIRFATAAHKDGSISLAEREEIFADAKYMLTGR